MNNITTLLIFIITLIAYPCYSENYNKNVLGVISGKAIYYDDNGIEQPIIGRNIEIIYNKGLTKRKVNTDTDGEFILAIKNPLPLIKGEEIKIKINDKKYFIISPYNGVMFSPRSLTNYKLKIVTITNESKIKTNKLSAQFNLSRNIKYYKDSIFYTVQVCSTSSKDEANKKRNYFIKLGYDAFIKESIYDGKHKVLISQFENKKSANRLKNTIRSKFKKDYGDAFVRITP